jgi:hypothetical protein
MVKMPGFCTLQSVSESSNLVEVMFGQTFKVTKFEYNSEEP